MRNIKLLIFVFCICFSLTSCQKNTVTNINTESNLSVITSEFIEPSTSDVQDKITSSKPVTAIIPNDLDAGKAVTAIGELQDDRYSKSLLDLQEILSSHKYNISLAVYSVDGSKGLAYNTESGIFGACTVKAAYTLYACKQMESGNGSLQTPITYEQKHYESGTGDMQYSSFGSVFTLETALEKSMSISDNVGYMMSVDYFGRDGYNSWISDLNCESLMIKPTVWSLKTRADDLVKIWCEIYNYFQTDSEYSRFLYNSCTNTSGKYATATLDEIEYSHKQGHNSTGDWLSLSDAGIVWKGNTPYVIAIVTDAPGPNSYSAGEFAKIIDIVHNELF